VNTTTATSREFVDERRKMRRAALGRCVLVFLVSFLLLFLGMTRRPSVFDEGIVVTAAMRVAAGQIPHRDFYALYGPAQFYILAGLFKLFGKFLLVERLFDVFSKALVVTTVYTIASAYCRKSIAGYTYIVALLWLFGLDQWPASPMVAVSFLNLTSSILILPVFAGRASPLSLLAAGALAGLASLFRYDTGIALLVVHACAISIAVYLRGSGISKRLRTFASTFWPYLMGFACVTLPPLLYYLSVAPIGPLVHDMILYPAKYYYRGRNLPFPAIDLYTLEDLGIYLPIMIVAATLYVAVAGYFGMAGKDARSSAGTFEKQEWQGFLVTLGILTAAMYFKGYVRVSLFQMSLAIIPSLLLIAVLFQHRLSFSRPARILVACLMGTSFLPAASLAFDETKDFYINHLSVPEYIFSVVRGVLPQAQASWCKSGNPLTRGLCFLPEMDRARTIEFIESHTRPDQRLYVGLTRHDKIFAADNITYFAAQRLPATRWSELDPDLESRYDVQTQMVDEFERNVPPYIVLDLEFAQESEPNDSSRSSGVTLLDDYIRDKYQQVASFGLMSVWQRRYSPDDAAHRQARRQRDGYATECASIQMEKNL
jgi:hypothetical protein